MTTAMLFFLLKKNLDFCATMCPILIDAPPLLIPDPENATIEELKQVSPVGSNETATRCTAIQMLLAGVSKELVRRCTAGNQSGIEKVD